MTTGLFDRIEFLSETSFRYKTRHTPNANMLYRLMMTEVPVWVIHSVIFHSCKCAVQPEFLAMIFGQIILDNVELEKRAQPDESDVVGERLQEFRGNLRARADRYIGVYASDIKGLPVVYGTQLIVGLQKDDELDLEFIVRRDNGLHHAKAQPCSTVIFEREEHGNEVSFLFNVTLRGMLSLRDIVEIAMEIMPIAADRPPNDSKLFDPSLPVVEWSTIRSE